MKLLTGQGFAALVRSGTYRVLEAQEMLDRINVFPVPDADTGANLVATLSAATEALTTLSSPAVGEAARAAAGGALFGARGNSGAIFAQFLDGFARGLHLKREVTISQFALAASAGAEAAYQAVQSPREGTILSVFKAWATELRSQAELANDFREFFERGLHAARLALAETPRLLEVLARSKVVDAGGQGLVFFLEGFGSGARGRAHGAVPDLSVVASPEVYQRVSAAPGNELRAYTVGGPLGGDAGLVGDPSFRYCAEGLLSAGHVDGEALRLALGKLGESLVVAGSGAWIRVHIHTNEPDTFLQVLESFGPVERFKVDDMAQQQAARENARRSLLSRTRPSIFRRRLRCALAQ